MASDPAPVSFDSIIQAGRANRDRKKAEQLASTIFGKNRQDRNPPTGPKNKLAGSPSLASRITKPVQRSASSSSVNRSRVESAYEKASRTNDHSRGPGFSIRGAAGPYVVVGSNFAPGTSAADIRSAMEQIAGEMMSCVIITSNPTVIAEMVFTEKAAAEMIVATFNNQKADGRLLHLYFKTGPPTRLEILPPERSQVEPTYSNRGADNRSDLFPDKLGNRAPRHSNVAEPEYHDGRFGFDSKDNEGMDMEVHGDIDSGHREYRDERNFAGARSDRRDYRQDYAGGNNPRPGNYEPRDNRRLQPTQRLYSDSMYSRSRQNGYR